MPQHHRVLPEQPYGDLAAYLRAGGGRGLDNARSFGPAAIIEQIDESGLRGRGGGGFPTGAKWRTVAQYAAAGDPATVVVNGAEGEPGTFKDRAIIRANPYAVIEGALVAAHAVGADRVVLALKQSFTAEADRLAAAVAVCANAGWCEAVTIEVFGGPGEYLFGEETGLLEALDGRPPFPRIAPPFRHGVDEVGTQPDDPAGTVMAEPGPPGAPPTLVNNVETIANVAGILAEGAGWFRAVGTAASPGTVVCTVTGDTRRHGVGEFPMGTALGTVIDEIGGGAGEGRRLVAALSGVANPLVPAEKFATPLTHEDMHAAGSGLGAAGFLVFDDETDLAAVAAGVSRFLAVESCGQCTPCKQDGLAIAEHLVRICGPDGNDLDLVAAADRLTTVADGARCYLATQHQLVIESILALFPEHFRRHVEQGRDRVEGVEGAEPVEPVEPVGPVLIAPLVDIVDGVAVLDDRQRAKQPDWSFDETDSGKLPADRLAPT